MKCQTIKNEIRNEAKGIFTYESYYMKSLLCLILIIMLSSCESKVNQSPKLDSEIVNLLNSELLMRLKNYKQRDINKLATFLELDSTQKLQLYNLDSVKKIEFNSRNEMVSKANKFQLAKNKKENLVKCIKESNILSCLHEYPKVHNSFHSVFAQNMNLINSKIIEQIIDNNWFKPEINGSFCSTIKEGRFYTLTSDENPDTIIINRNLETQSESLQNDIMTLKIKWVDDCQYELYPLEEDNIVIMVTLIKKVKNNGIVYYAERKKTGENTMYQWGVHYKYDE